MLKPNNQRLLPEPGRRVFESRSGYKFDPDEFVWALDRNVKVNTSSVREMLDPMFHQGYISTLLYYAENLSPAHTRNLDAELNRFLTVSGASEE